MAQRMGLHYKIREKNQPIQEKPHVHMTQLEYVNEETYPKFTQPIGTSKP